LKASLVQKKGDFAKMCKEKIEKWKTFGPEDFKEGEIHSCFDHAGYLFNCKAQKVCVLFL